MPNHVMSGLLHFFFKESIFILFCFTYMFFISPFILYPLCLYYGIWFGVFMEFIYVGLCILCLLLGSFLLFFCSILMFLAFVLSYFLVFVTKRLMTLCLLMRDRKRIDPDGRGGGKELGEVEGGKTIIRVYFVRRKKSILNKREEKRLEDSKL